MINFSKVIVSKISDNLWHIIDLEESYELLISNKDNLCIKWIKEPKNSWKYLEELFRLINLY
jgi:hypothetical protein